MCRSTPEARYPGGNGPGIAGNETLFSPDGLIEDGLLRAGDCKGQSFPAATVDYDRVIPFKSRLLETAPRGVQGETP